MKENNLVTCFSDMGAVRDFGNDILLCSEAAGIERRKGGLTRKPGK